MAAAAGAVIVVLDVVVAVVVEDGGRSYFCSCSRYASAVGTAPQETSSVLVLARTS